VLAHPYFTAEKTWKDGADYAKTSGRSNELKRMAKQQFADNIATCALLSRHPPSRTRGPAHKYSLMISLPASANLSEQDDTVWHIPLNDHPSNRK
jgi:hypothetical protein